MRGWVNTVGRSWRIRTTEGAEVLDHVRETAQPVILTVWHNRAVMAVPFFLRTLLHRGHPVAVMASGSRDGEIVSRAIMGWGVPMVRGSATRGGSQALLGAVRALRRDRASTVVIPDGPKGPIYRYKAGVLHLARLSGAPILPVGLAASRYRAIGSWDRLMIPKAFSTIAAVVGTPQPVARDLDDDSLEKERARLEDLLNGLTARAEAAAGRAGSSPVPTRG